VVGFGPSLVLSTGRRSAPGWLPVPRPRLIKPRERVRCRWQLLFTVVFTGQTACPACSSIARCPVETGSPPRSAPIVLPGSRRALYARRGCVGRLRRDPGGTSGPARPGFRPV
jgi:hypothetical protein